MFVILRSGFAREKFSTLVVLSAKTSKMLADRTINDMLKALSRSHGITFIEIILVVSLVSLLSLLSTGFYARFLTQNSVQNATDQIVNSLRKAQMYSISGKQGGVWGVRYATNNLTLFLQSDAAFDEQYTVASSISITPFNVTFTKATGAPSSNPTITVSGGSITKTISINSQGVVSRN